MEKYGVCSSSGEKIAGKRIGKCTECGSPVYGTHDKPKRICGCKAPVSIDFGKD